LKRSYIDPLPTGNIDLAPTVLWLLGVPANTPMDGRVLSEALTIEAPPVGPPATHRLELTNAIGQLDRRQYLQISEVNHTIYLDEGNGSLSPHKSN
jgi:arylsulfatase A-like enzyme